jgi:hypothetical protein
MNSNTAMMPTMRFSIIPLQLFAELRVQAARQEKRDDDPDEYQITHKLVSACLGVVGLDN